MYSHDVVAEFFPNTFFIFNAPWWGLLLVLIVGAVLAMLGERLYRWDINTVYGPVLRKINELIADMEELSKTN